MSYCSFEAFGALAWNYLDLDSHPLFDHIRQLLQVCQISPADVAENLTLKSSILAPEENAELKAREEALRKASAGSSSSSQEPAAAENSDATASTTASKGVEEAHANIHTVQI
ncbi:hypothetical protein ACLOJK_021032 [Asimina triloba]